MNHSNVEPLLVNIMGDSPEPWEKPSTLAKLVGTVPRTIIDWIHKYPIELPAMKTPAGFRLRRSDLIKFLKRYHAGEVK